MTSTQTNTKKEININNTANNKKKDKNNTTESVLNNIDIEQIALILSHKWDAQLDHNLIFIKRAINWLYDDHIVEAHNIDSIIKFINKLYKLGIMISEPGSNFSANSYSSISSDDARKIRSYLTNDRDFIAQIYDKTHPHYSKSIDYLNELNAKVAQEGAL